MQSDVQKQAEKDARVADWRSLRFAANRGVSRRVKHEFGALLAAHQADDAVATGMSKAKAISEAGVGLSAGLRLSTSRAVAAIVITPTPEKTTPRSSHPARYIGHPSTHDRSVGASRPRPSARAVVARPSVAITSASPRKTSVDADGTISPFFNEIGSGRKSAPRDVNKRPSAARGTVTPKHAASSRDTSSPIITRSQAYAVPKKPMPHRTVVRGGPDSCHR